MKWLIIGLLVLILSVSVALVALPDPGYVLVGYGNHSVETTLLVFIAALAVGYLLLRALAGLWHVPGNVQRWNHRRRERRLRELFDAAVIELADGRIDQAERRFGRLTRHAESPLEVYLSAARAANRVDADNRRDYYLKLGLHRYPKAEVAIAIVQAELQLGKEQLEQAQTTIARLQEIAPSSTEVSRLRMHLYTKRRDWDQLRRLLPELQRNQVLDKDQWQRLAIRAHREQLLELAGSGDFEVLNKHWKQLPTAIQSDEGLLAVYIEQLVRSGAEGSAEQLLREQLGKNWNAQLVYLYGDLSEADPASQQSVAENWIEKHPEDPVLLLTLGKISLRNQLWGKARNYLESSVARHPTPEGYRLLGALLEQLGEEDEASNCYRKGIELPVQQGYALSLTASGDKSRQLSEIPTTGSV